MALASPARSLFKPSSLPSSPALKGGSGTELDTDALFETPPELVCPITQSLFYEPVLTAAGQVYERAAIEEHLQHSQTDPLTRQQLVNKSLTPVFVLKSRAQEYREAAAAACLERACAAATPDPVRFVRRAAELVSGSGGRGSVPGLTSEAVDYITQHPSNAYDRLVLQVFAESLRHEGYRDRAAAIYRSLLATAADRPEQAQLLRACLSCWAPPGSLAASSGGVGADPLLLAGDDPAVISKLVAMFAPGPGRNGAGAAAAGTGAAQQQLSWGQIIDICQEAGLGTGFAMRLCEQLLFGPSPMLLLSRCGGSGSSDDGSDASSAVVAASGGPPGWATEREVLLKYVQVLTGSLRQQQTEAERRLQDLERWRRRRRSSGSSSSSSGGSLSSLSRRRGGLQLPGALLHPALIFGVAMLAPQLLSWLPPPLGSRR